MGSKRLKAISVTGTGLVALANPRKITSIARALARDLPAGPRFFGRDLEKLNQQLAAEGNGTARCDACTEACITPCQAYFQDVPGEVHDRKWSGAWQCIPLFFRGTDEDSHASLRAIVDWRLERRAAFELNVLSNRYGLNQYDILMGMVPWLIACQKAGLISEFDGQDHRLVLPTVLGRLPSLHCLS
jgi:aldehyde:ferredoxin oxidoreductase